MPTLTTTNLEGLIVQVWYTKDQYARLQHLRNKIRATYAYTGTYPNLPEVLKPIKDDLPPNA
jgi:hypothetical protein